MKQHETPVKNTEDKFEDNDNEKILEESMEKKEEENCDDNCMENSSKEKNEINSERKNYSNIINNPKNLDLLQNSETPVKKSNIFNNYSANNIFSNNKNSLSSKGGSNFSAAPLNPFNTTSKPPFFYMPFVPKMNMKLGIPIPILFPIDPSFLRRQISENKKKHLGINILKYPFSFSFFHLFHFHIFHHYYNNKFLFLLLFHFSNYLHIYHLPKSHY